MIGPQNRRRMRVKHDGDRRPADAICVIANGFQQGGVSAVDAVKISNADRTATKSIKCSGIVCVCSGLVAKQRRERNDLSHRANKQGMGCEENSV